MFGRELLLILRRDRLLLFYSALSLGSVTVMGLILTATRLGAFGMALAGFFALGQFVLLYGLSKVEGNTLSRMLTGIASIYLINLALFAPLLLFGEHLEAWVQLAVSAAVSLIAVVIVWRRLRKEGRLLLSVSRPA